MLPTQSAARWDLTMCMLWRVQIAPKEDELASLLAYQGDRRALSQPEQFLVMMSEIPRLVDKLNVLRSLLQFEVC